jgi:type IV pilus assembly protein PilB
MSDAELGELLVRLGVIDDQQLDQALAYQRRIPGTALGQALEALGHITEAQVAKLLCRHFQLPYVDLSIVTAPPDVVALVSPSVARDFGIIPVKVNGDLLIVATDNPRLGSSTAEISAAVGREVRVALAASSCVTRLRDKYY